MSIGIYKITNKINGKCYIGQSVDIQRRWNSHKNTNEKYPIHLAIAKYGLKNFTFEILEECLVIELDKKEEYYIKKFNSFGSGYNLTAGGSNSSFKKLNAELLLELTEDLKNSNLTNNEIGIKYGVGADFVSMINNGKAHVRDIEYPIRKNFSKTVCLDCGFDISRGSSRCIECYSVFQRVIKVRPDKETLLNEVLKDGFVSVGDKYGVTDNTIRSWMKAYGLPHRMKDLKPKKEKILREKAKDFKLNRDDEDFTFETIEDFVQYVLDHNLSSGTVSNIRGGLNRMLQGKRKSYLGFKLNKKEN